MAESIVKRVEYSLFLRTLFGGRRSGVAVERVATLMRDVYFDAGQVIYRRAEASTHIYFIVSGQIVLDAPGLAPWTFGPRDGVGFLDAMQDAPHARTARAAADVHALAFSVEDWFDVLEGHPELGRGALLDHADSVAKMIEVLGVARAFPGGHAPVPADLRRPPGLVERMLALTDSPIFARAGIQAVAVLAQRARPVALHEGAEIVREGAPHDHRLWLVAQGEVALRRSKESEAGRVGPGALVGGLAVMARDDQSATLSAVTDTVALEFSEYDLMDVMDDHFDFSKAIFAYMARERGRLMEIVAQERAPISS